MSLELGFFALTLIAVATLPVPVRSAGIGLGALVVVKLTQHFDLVAHLQHETSDVLNLLGLLLGFAVLASHVDKSGLPQRVPHWLPRGAWGAFTLLALVWLLSSVLDNIAAALIGGSIARVVFRDRVHVGMCAAIVTASNAGGAFSVLGDTTTTLLWLHDYSVFSIARAFVPSLVALCVTGFFAVRQQQALSPLLHDGVERPPLDVMRLVIAGAMLVAAAVSNALWGLPAVGVWAVLLGSALVRPFDTKTLRGAVSGAVLLVVLVVAASLVPVEGLPAPTAWSTFGLGVVSAVFDNIPLTKLAIAQGGYDGAFLAFAVGVGGSMMWFGSSAGVALSSTFEQARSTRTWLRDGWHVALAYVAGCAVLLWIGWRPG